MPYSSRRLPQTQQNSDRLSTIRPVSSPSPVSAVSHASSGYRYDNPAPPYDNPQQRLLQREPQYAQPVPTHLSYGPSGPAYQPPAPVFSPPPQSSIYHTFSPPPSQHGGSTLPFFEAALARSRGENVPNPMVSPPPLVNMQPLPLYLPPSDMNHPDVNVGFHQSNTVRFTHTATPVGRQPAASQSPSPGYDKSYDGGYGDEGYRYGGNEEGEMEKGLLTYPTQDRAFDGDEKKEYYSNPYETGPFWDEKSAMGGLNDELGDIGHLPAIHVQSPTTGSNALSFADMNAQIMGSAATQHFGPAPTGRVGRREHNAAGHRRIKQKATLDANGFFAVDMPIPTRLAQFLPVKGVEEQKSTRYTAVTTDPDDFAASGLRLRQNLCNPPRQTELFIVITMYNEDAQLFCRTLYGVMKNISHLCGRKNSRVWGKDGWQKVVVCIVADGRKNVNPRVLDCLSALGVFQEGAMTSKVKDRPVTAHVFEYTTSFALDPDMHFKYPDKGIVPCQIIFCMKEKNAKKINSHRWFFNAFAPLLAPNICILLDVGTRPETKSLYHLWKAFDRNSKVGGACGEIATFKGKTWRSLLNPLVAAQCFEYKMSNILDKPMESLFGYCTVLPGAFSAYRWIALQNNADGTGPLASYFQGEQLNTGKADTFTANMVRYLAEDRILCFEIIAKAKANWVLKFVKSAVGETDCPDSIPEFIAQRRRWLNGSFFAAVYSLIHVRQVWRSDHSFPRKVSLMLEFVYNALNLLFTWFSLANFYVFFVILTSALEAPQFGIPKIWVLNRICQYGYLGVLVACFIFAMGNRPQGSPWKYKSAIYLFAVLTMYMLVGAVLCTVQAVKNIGSPVFTNMVVSLVTTYGVFIVSSILAMDPWHILTCFAQYILFSPTYINVLNIYAYSNLHDLSWGTKGSDAAEPTELGAVSGVGNQVEVALVSAQQDIDIAYQDALDNIRLKRAKVDADELPPKGEVSEQKQKDVYANFRTNLLLLWSLSNALLASLVLSGGDASATFTGGGSNVTAVYMLVILVFVSGMAIFRFICSTLYLIFRLFGA